MKSKVNKTSIKSVVSFGLIWLLPPMTIYYGIFHLDDRKYYFISLMLIVYATIAFLMRYEKREPKLREMMMLAVISAIGVAGRAAFYMVPQFKPVLAVAIIAGVALDPSAGFLVGALIAFVSNFFFGQGPWTPWQMFAMGAVGYVAGVCFKSGRLPKRRMPLAIYGFLASVIIYGGIMNPASVLMFQAKATIKTLLASYILGLPFDLVLGFASFIFLWLFGEVMLEKIERVKIKYGLLKK